MIPADHWMTIDNQTGYIISSSCPPGYCCTNDNCDYLYDKDSLCIEGRDHGSKLCGRCIDGYSEAINGSPCTLCDRYHFEYLLLPTAFAMIISLVLILTNTEMVQKKDKESEQPKELPNKCCQVVTSKHYRLMMKIMIFKCMVYYEQGIAQLFLSNPTKISIMAFASMFDLSVVSNTGEPDTLWCLYPGMNAKQLILLDRFICADYDHIFYWIGLCH